ncbi:MAG: 3-deoxy-D-manno-octulosonic acid transferase, partial [Pyrinomonadaceae bacterium]
MILLPRFLFDAFRHGKYVAGFRERLGILTPIKGNQRPVIWLHCVSVGETQAARPLVQSLQGQFPEYALAVSTITVTGQRLAREIFKNSAVKVFYFPFDWGFTTRRALNRINPVVVLLMETELWPGFLRKCSQRNIPVAVVNGRLSERSFRRYRLIKPFISRVLRSLEMALMQTDEDAERICGLGLSKDKIFVSGNLKFDAGTIPLNSSLTEELRQNFDSPVRPLLLAASTHASEERILIEAFRRLQSDALRRPRLLIAPRHPERFAEVASLMAASGFLWTRRTTAAPGHAGEHDLILLDTIGELPAAYPLAEIVFVGGSITKNGGHNLLEPAALGSCIVTGAHTFNFTAIVKTFAEADAIIQLPPLSEAEAEVELAKVFSELLAEATRRKGLGQRAKALVQENLGATDRTVKLIEPIFTRTTGM